MDLSFPVVFLAEPHAVRYGALHSCIAIQRACLTLSLSLSLSLSFLIYIVYFVDHFFLLLYSFSCGVLEFEVISTIHKRRGQYKITSKHNTAKRATCITKHNTTERRWRHRTKWVVNFTNQTLFNTKKTRWHTEERHKHLPLSSQYRQCGKHRPYYKPRFAPPCSSWACKSMTTTLLPSVTQHSKRCSNVSNHNCYRPAWHKALLHNDCTGRFWQNKPSLHSCVSAIQTRPACLWPCPSLCQSPVSRTRWSLCHGKRSLLPPLLCCWGLSLAYDDTPLTITVPLPGHWKSRPRSSSISGYLFFFFRMPSVSHATDLEKAPVKNWPWKSSSKKLTLKKLQYWARFKNVA